MIRINDFIPSFATLMNIHVLVVDNDIDSRYLWTVLLEDYGVKVNTAGTIKEALVFLLENTPDILVCEIRFFGESIYPLINQLRHAALIRDKPIPILVTSTCLPSSLAQNLAVQVEAYLLKPINPDDFVTTIRNLIHPASLVKSEIN